MKKSIFDYYFARDPKSCTSTILLYLYDYYLAVTIPVILYSTLTAYTCNNCAHFYER